MVAVNGDPGFTSESFEFIKNIVQARDEPLIAAIMVDDMSIKKKNMFNLWAIRFSDMLTLAWICQMTAFQKQRMLVFLCWWHRI